MPDIVSVQFMSEIHPGEFVGREYSYYADVPLQVGDCVAVSSRRGESLARVTEVGVPEYRIDPKIKKILKHITSEPIPTPKRLEINESVQMKMEG